MVEWYAGLSVALSALASALVSPVWGHLADRYGRKPMMIRASMVMTFTMGGLAFVPNVFWMLFLRILNGLFAGYVPNATALIASQAPQRSDPVRERPDHCRRQEGSCELRSCRLLLRRACHGDRSPREPRLGEVSRLIHRSH